MITVAQDSRMSGKRDLKLIHVKARFPRTYKIKKRILPERKCPHMNSYEPNVGSWAVY